MRFAVAVPVGPHPRELGRLTSLIESVRSNVGDDGHLVLIDDRDLSGDLAGLVDWDPRKLDVLNAPQLGPNARVNDRMTASTLTFLRWLSASDCHYAVKLDTDALVIGDFRPRLAQVFERSLVGVCGACERNRPDGAARDLSLWRRQLLLGCSPVQMRTGGARPYIKLALSGRAARQRQFLRDAVRRARRHGYRLGEHCLGGAYGISAQLARTLFSEGALRDPTITCGTGLGEDVVLGLITRAAGFELRTLVDPGDPFALRHQGLLDTPEQLVAGGHSIVHSLKCQAPEDEQQLREVFRRFTSQSTS